MADNVETPMDENPASQRHWMYGFNAFVLVIVGLVVLIFLLAICENKTVKDYTKFDLSSSGANSLSQGSRKMLQEIDTKPEKYQVWSLFTDPTDQQKRDLPDQAAEQTRHREQINDLLRQYARASSHITVEDRGDASRDEIEKQIREKYKDEFKAYQDVVEGFDPLVKRLSVFLKEEADAIGANGQKPGTPADEVRAAAMIQAEFSSGPSQFDQVKRMIHRETDSVLPQWSTLTSMINQTLDEIAPLFEVVSDPAKLKESGLPPTLVTYFTTTNEKYKAMGSELKKYKESIAKLPPLKVQDVLERLSRDTVVIMSDKSAKVIAEFDLYQDAPGSSGPNPVTTFAGEQAISSALYAMAKPDKVKVVFVTAAPARLLDDSHSDLKAILEQANFEVLEWSPSPASSPGAPPEPSGPPPAEGAAVVWVVFTPDAPNFQMMMMAPPNPQPVIEATRKHMQAGGQVLFMADAAGMMGPGFPYADLTKDFGLEVQSKYSVVNLMEQTDPDTGQTNRSVRPFVFIERFEDTEITTPIQAMPTVFGPMQTNQGVSGYATVVKVISPVPTGVETHVLVKTPYSRDYWGETEMMGGEPKFDKDVDMAAPVPLAAVAIKDKGKKGADGKPQDKRIAVIGAKMLGSNFFLELSVTQQVGNVRYRIPRFPGNAELMKNTILWLAGYENMIAVSPKNNVAARIKDVKPVTLAFIRVGMLVLAPLVALVIGGLVWMSRRR